MGAHLESLALSGANVPSVVPALAACAALTELQLASSEVLGRAALLRALRALPRIVCLDLCLAVDPPFHRDHPFFYAHEMDAELVAACSGGGRPRLTGVVSSWHGGGMWLQPSLVPVDEWTYHPHYAR